MVRGLEVEAHQAEQRVQKPLGLAERQAEDDPQRQRGPDREVRVPPLASAKTVLRWYPRGNCILAQPDRDVAAALRPRSYSLQFRILYFVLYWRLTRLDFAATMTLPPDLYDGLDPTPAASVLAYTDSCTNAHMWFNIPGANGDASARELRDSLERDMTPAEVSRATELARVCMTSDYQDCEP